MAAEKLGGGGGVKARAWFCTTGLPSDIVIEVHDMSFHLHKFPLMDMSAKLHRIITALEQRERSKRRGRGRRRRKGDRVDDGNGGEIKEEHEEEEEEEDEGEAERIVSLPQFPGGTDTFEAAAKFCYGVKVELTAWNVAPLRCAAEYLEMTEDVAEDNLVARTERFLANSVLCSLKESIKTLKSCEELMPLAEDLGVVQRCLDSIAARASSVDPAHLFGWPVNESRASTAAERVLWNGIDTGARRQTRSSASSGGSVDSWFEELAILGLPMYKRVVAAMKTRGITSDVVEGSLLSYARCSIPGLSRATRRRHSSAPVITETEQRELLETVITNLPPERSLPAAPAASTSAATKFLFGLLRTANILHASEEARAALERKIGSQLERALPDDLLIPSYSYHTETLYDVDCIERILAHFLSTSAEKGGEIEEEEGVRSGEIVAASEGEGREDAGRRNSAERDGAAKAVAKLVDGYLAEISSDANLKVEKFCGLAGALPDEARVYHDGLYRAIDIYLKSHSRLTEEEKERVCGAMDYRRLTLEACTHAAQNERLPLRAVVQVLFFEQLQLRQAITGSLLSGRDQGLRPPPESTAVAAESLRGGERRRRTSWRAAIEENQVLRLDMDSMRNRVQELERECSSMKRALEKLDGGGGGGGGGAVAAAGAAEEGGRRGKGSGSKYGCRFTTQVCDSHERNVVQARTSRVGLSP